jgi:hypothetical protein
MHKILQTVLLAGSLLTCATSYGQDSQIRFGAPFLIITPDAKSAGYGDQGAATTPDNNSQYWNPAKYVFATGRYGGSYSFTPWLKNIADDINLHYLSGFYKLDDRQSISASLRYFSLGEIPLTNDLGQGPNGETEPIISKSNEFSIDLAYSRKLSPNLSTSILFRYLRSDLIGNSSVQKLTGTEIASTFAADIALYYQKVAAQNEYACGVNISNIGPKISYSNLGEKSFIPTSLRIGVRYTRSLGEKSKISALLETSKLLVPTPDFKTNALGEKYDANADKSVVSALFSSFGDAPGGMSEELKEFTYSVGTEYCYANTVALRAGYFHESEMKGNRKFYTFGFGINYKIYSFDGSYLVPSSGGSNSPLNNTFRFSVGVQIPR